MRLLLLLIASLHTLSAKPTITFIDDLPKHPDGIAGLFRGINDETIIKGPDGSIITASEAPGSIHTEPGSPAVIVTQPIIAAEPPAVESIAVEPISTQPAAAVVATEPQSIHVIETEIVDTPNVESEQSAELVGPSGVIKTKGSKSIVSGPSSTTISVPATAIGGVAPIATAVDTDHISPVVPLQEVAVTPIPVAPVQNFAVPIQDGTSGNTILASTPELLQPNGVGTDTLSLPSAEIVAPSIGSNGISPEYSLNVNLSPGSLVFEGRDVISSTLAPQVDSRILSSSIAPPLNVEVDYAPQGLNDRVDYQNVGTGSSTVAPQSNVEIDYSYQDIDDRRGVSSSLAPPVDYSYQNIGSGAVSSTIAPQSNVEIDYSYQDIDDRRGVSSSLAPPLDYSYQNIGSGAVSSTIAPQLNAEIDYSYQNIGGSRGSVSSTLTPNVDYSYQNLGGGAVSSTAAPQLNAEIDYSYQNIGGSRGSVSSTLAPNVDYSYQNLGGGAVSSTAAPQLNAEIDYSYQDIGDNRGRVSSTLAPAVDYSYQNAISSTVAPQTNVETDYSYQDIDGSSNLDYYQNIGGGRVSSTTSPLTNDYSYEDTSSRGGVSSTLAPPADYSYQINVGSSTVPPSTDTQGDYSYQSNAAVSSTLEPPTLGTINVAEDSWSDNSVGLSSTQSPQEGWGQSSTSNLNLVSSTTSAPIQSTTIAPNVVSSNRINLGDSQIGAVPQVDTSSSFGYINNLNEVVSSTIKPVTEGPILSSTIGSQASNIKLSQETVQKYLDAVSAGQTPEDILSPDLLSELSSSYEISTTGSPNIQRISPSTPGTVRIDGKLDLQQEELGRTQLEPRDLFLSPEAAGHYAAANVISSSDNFENLAKYGLIGFKDLFANLGRSVVSESRELSPATLSAITPKSAGTQSSAKSRRRRDAGRSYS